VKKHAWQLVPGDYTFMVGGSSQDLPLKQTVTLK
jgi:beta-glucosidase